MKKILLFILLLSTTATLLAQNLANGDFENFGRDTFPTYNRNGGMYNSSTCIVDGGSYAPSDTMDGGDRPIGFRTTDDFFGNDFPIYVIPTTDARSGQAALLRGDGFIGFGIMGIFDVETLVQEALPVDYPFDELPSAITGFYKHTSGSSISFPSGSCTNDGPLSENTTFEGGFAVYAQFFDDMDNLIAQVDTVLGDAAEFTEFDIPVEVITAGVQPAKFVFIMSSCPEFLSPNPIYIVGSGSIVDDVDFDFTVTSTEEVLAAEPLFDLSPNPVRHLLNLRTELPADEAFQIFDSVGRLWMSGKGGSQEIATDGLLPGVYLLKYGHQVQRFIKQ